MFQAGVAFAFLETRCAGALASQVGKREDRHGTAPSFGVWVKQLGAQTKRIADAVLVVNQASRSSMLQRRAMASIQACRLHQPPAILDQELPRHDATLIEPVRRWLRPSGIAWKKGAQLRPEAVASQWEPKAKQHLKWERNGLSTVTDGAEEHQKGKKAVDCMDEMGCLRDDLHAACSVVSWVCHQSNGRLSVVCIVACDGNNRCWGAGVWRFSVVGGFIGWGCCSSLPFGSTA